MPSNSIETKTNKNSFCVDAASSSFTVRRSPLRCCAIAASFELTSTSHHRRLGRSGRQGLSRWWENTLKDFPFSSGSSVKRGRIKTEEVAPAQHQEDIKKQWQQGSSGENGITNTKGGAGVALIAQREESNHLRLPDSEFVVWFQRHKLDWVSSTELDAVVTLYLDLFDSSKGQDDGIRIIAALKFFIPEVSRLGGRGLPRAARALKGWNLARPQ